MQLNANNRIEIKKVLLRKHDGLKFVIIPRKSSIEVGYFVSIKKIAGVSNGKHWHIKIPWSSGKGVSGLMHRGK